MPAEHRLLRCENLVLSRFETAADRCGHDFAIFNPIVATPPDT
ncbi:hypothetical protein RMSM_03304 [Rhodopirellula maiorica SM1]|uniref:Uncharacterized protein n=1 Tax=Rhodopirellula maiorica SM1 TaxID=1265738 RepID=M5RKQ4_9BACT|nr:hypothetical protein RMSM_03304 [Rhodopirellula maiorica SM1]